jgi:hypothetical protein
MRILLKNEKLHRFSDLVISSEWGSSGSKRPLAPPQAGAYFGNSMLLKSCLTQDLVNTQWHTSDLLCPTKTQGVWLWPFTSRGVKSLREPRCLGVLYLSKLECLPRLYHPFYTPENLIGCYRKNLNYLLYILAWVRTGTNIPKKEFFKLDTHPTLDQDERTSLCWKQDEEGIKEKMVSFHYREAWFKS